MLRCKPSGERCANGAATMTPDLHTWVDGLVMYVDEGESDLILFNPTANYFHPYCNFYRPQ